MITSIGRSAGIVTLAVVCAACQPAGKAPDTQASTQPGLSADQPSGEATPSGNGSEEAIEQCGLEQAHAFIDRSDTPETRKLLERAVGARPIRWIRPGDPVTQDYSLNRLNVMVDENNRITSLRCG